MPFLNFLFQPKNELESGGRSVAPVQSDASEPEKTCPNCHKSIPVSRLWSNWNTCQCGYHFRMGGRQRLQFLTDKDSFQELFAQVEGKDPLDFPGYQEKLETVRKVSSEREAVLCGTARIGGQPCCLFIMEPRFMMGSMGTAVGEKITRLFEYATEHGMSVVGYTVSGGARMQEGILSRMQMAKTSAALGRHAQKGLLYISVLTDPTTGGVTASFASLGDIILAEPGALIGFAGPRVIQQTIGQTLPEGFQRAEYQEEHGFVDAVVPRSQMRETLVQLLLLHEKGGREWKN